MKYYLQVQDKTTPASPVIYKFVYTVDTKSGVEIYSIITPPGEGSKFDSKTRMFDKLAPADLTAAYGAFETDQKKIAPLQKWRVISGWAVSESPADDGFPPWPGARL